MATVTEQQRRVHRVGLALSAPFWLPLSLWLLFLNHLLLFTVSAGDSFRNTRRRIFRHPNFRSRRILITGVSTSYGLRVARAFYETGHNVVGADQSTSRLPSPAYFSTALHGYYKLEKDPIHFAKQILRTVLLEEIDLWVDCSERIPASTLAHAQDVIEAKTTCVCFVAPEQLRNTLSTSRKFLEFSSSAGLHVPEVHTVRSRDEVHGLLNQAHGRKRYYLTSHGVPSPANPRTALPRRTLSQTYNEVSQLRIQHDSAWVLEQSTEGLPRYDTFAILVRGRVKALAVSQVVKPMTFQVVHDSNLTRVMQSDVEKLAQHLGPDVSCHLRVVFCIEEKQTDDGVEHRLLPVDGGITPDYTALAFQGYAGSNALIQAYFGVMPEVANTVPNGLSNGTSPPHPRIPQPSHTPVGVYSGANDTWLVSEALGQLAIGDTILAYIELVTHVFFWYDVDFSFHDPLPCWYLWQVYVPLLVIKSAFTSRPRSAIQTHS
jgi:hypothetical protein